MTKYEKVGSIIDKARAEILELTQGTEYEADSGYRCDRDDMIICYKDDDGEDIDIVMYQQISE